MGSARRSSHIRSGLFFALLWVVAAGAEMPRSVAITFDDVPAVPPPGAECDPVILTQVAEQLVTGITARDLPVTGFVSDIFFCDSLRCAGLPPLLEIWVRAGIELGNHTASHLDLNLTSPSLFAADILRAEPLLRGALAPHGQTLRYFRYPYLHTGADPRVRARIAVFLAESGYEVAPVTITSREQVFAELYARARQRSDQGMMRCIGEAFIRHLEEVTAYYERRALAVLGREPAQVLLLHANEMNAAYFDEIIAMYTRRGYRFVTLAAALEDPAYKLPDNYIGWGGLSWIDRWAPNGGAAIARCPAIPEWVAELHRMY